MFTAKNAPEPAEKSAVEPQADDVFVLPMSFAQERLWFESQLDRKSSAYNLAAGIRLSGIVDVALVERCLAEIVGRHEALRTTFAVIDGRPSQVVHTAGAPRLAHVDASALDGGMEGTELRRRIECEAEVPFDLGAGPLLRLSLLSLGAREHVLLWLIHHSVFDGWSTGIVLREFAALYAAYAAGRPSPLPPMALQYGDFAHWQRQRVDSGALARELGYWKERLAGGDGLLELPTDRPRPAVRSSRGARAFSRLDPALTAGLQALALGQGTTLYTVLLAGWKALLGRWTGAIDLRVGTPVTNRSRGELENVVGCFANTLVLRTDLGGNPSFLTCLERVKETVRQAQAHQEIPFDHVVEAVRPARDLSHAPLCQVLFALQPDIGRLPEIPGLEVELMDLDPGGSQFDLSLEIAAEQDALAVAVEYDTDLFEAPTIERLAHHYRALLGSAVAEPHARLSELRLLSGDEEAQLLRWSGAEEAHRTVPAPADVFARFAGQAARTPGAVALMHDGTEVTYESLARWSHAIAARLRAVAVGPEVRVGICVPRSPGMVATVLGVLEAGGAYVPLDPDYPRERIATIITDGQIEIVVTTAAAAAGLPEGLRLVTIDEHDGHAQAADIVRERDNTWAAPPPLPEQAAYVLYTSGSTGRPKGVVVPHRAIATFVDAAAALYQITGEDRVLQFASLSFDASAEEIFPCLSRGATLVLRTEAMLESVPAFLAACANQGITVLDLPTMYWHRLVVELAAGLVLPETIRLVIIGGEAALPERVAAWRAAVGDRVRLVNTYGPTEATVVATACELSGLAAPGQGSDVAVPIGGPLRNARVYVLDRHGQPVPTGVIGELCVAGAGLARGYWAQPTLTAERFVPDPLAGSPGERLYRTGDRARWRADGQLEFVGRLDHQVKVRGFRIELGEIEARLAEQAGVREAVAVVWHGGDESESTTDGRIVAYVSGGDLSGAALRRALRERLPDFMVPSTFVVLPELPRTPQGKIDRRALPPPQDEEPKEAGVPRTETEATLAAIWAELLGRERVGTKENFFELGGDSIMALQVVAKARAVGIAIGPKQVLQHQTIEELAAVATLAEHLVGQEAGAGESGQEVSLPAGPVPLAPMQRWFFAQEAPNPHHFNQSVLLTVAGTLDRSALEAALAVVARHHDAFALRFTRQGNTWEQHHAAPGAARVEVAYVDLAHIPAGQESAELTAVASECQRRLDVGQGPLLFAAAIDLGVARPGRLLLVAHHLVIDGVSWRILLGDLDRAYRQAAAVEPIRLGHKSSPFSAWCGQLAARALTGASAPMSGDPADPTPSLLVDGPTGSALEGDTARSVTRFGVDETRALLGATRPYRLRVDELLLTALGGALGATLLPRAQALWVDCESHGRDQLDEGSGLDVSRTVGWFTRIFPVRLEVPPEIPEGEALKAVKECVRSAARAPADVGGRRHAAPVSFNYLGHFDDLFAGCALFGIADEDVGQERDPGMLRAHELEVDAAIVRGCLQITWSYSTARCKSATIERLGDAFRRQLSALVTHCQRPEVGGATPSDFPLARLEQQEIDQCLGGARDVEDVYPLSPLQQGLLFHSLFEPGAGVYVEQVTCRLEGELDEAAFGLAWQSTVAHHPALRTTLLWEGTDEPLQVVRRSVAVSIETEDWRALGPAAQKARLDERLAADRTRGFDLASGPLTRIALFRLDEQSHVVLWSHHHIILDGWSAALVLRDVFAAYEAHRGGRAPTLAIRPAYRDYIAWLTHQDGGASEPFWRRTLGGFSAATPLPYDRTRTTSDETPRGLGSDTRLLSPEATERLQAFAQRHHITLGTLVQAAWAFVLGRTARTDDVVFGITVAGRGAPLPGIDGMVGLFINTVPQRLTVPGGVTVAAWLEGIFAATAELGAHEQTPLARTRGFAAVPAGQPLFESLLVFENYPGDPRAAGGAPGLRVSDIGFWEETNYPLTLTAIPGRSLELRLSHDRRRFESAAATRLLGLVETALFRLTKDPAARLGDLPLVGEREHEVVVGDCNATNRTYGDERPIHELIAAAAARHPEAVAVVFDERRLSYRELDERANQVAHALRKRGVGPDVLVAICAERSVELVVGLLAILKAGGAYVPIDPEYPEERIAFMLEDAGAPVLLAQWPIACRLPAHGAMVICLDADRAEIEREPKTAPDVAVAIDNLAYTIYTSGSTGKPKGAGNSHRGLFNRLAWMQERYALDASDRVLQKTPFSFDVSVWEFFWPLMFGATLVVARPGDHRDGDRLVELITRHQVTTMHFVPPMLQAFLETDGLSACTSLRRVICSGEALGADLAMRFHERLGAELHNLYGPTEASIDVTAWHCRKGDTGALVPIGHPIANTQIYLVDRHGHPVPMGVPGELCIGGVGLARGYHRRAALTAERFVPDPFSQTPGARLYRTGDLCRQRDDGAIEFLGRLDHQIKIRGLRVELGEIEGRLAQHPGVREAVVVARAEAHGGKRLVAYVSAPAEATAPQAEALRAWVGEVLPAYMVPAQICVLDRLPLSPNGKVDRRALPVPEAVGAGGPGYIAPRSETERILCEVWAEVLHRPEVGIADNFFEIGGDSIVTLQVIARVSRRGLRLAPKALFEHPTIAELSAFVTQASADGTIGEPAPAAISDRGLPSKPELSAAEWSDLLDELQ